MSKPEDASVYKPHSNPADGSKSLVYSLSGNVIIICANGNPDRSTNVAVNGVRDI